MNTQDTSSRFSPKTNGIAKGSKLGSVGPRPHILARREARRQRRER